MVMYVTRTEETCASCSVATVWDSDEICSGFYQGLVCNADVGQEDKEYFLLLTFWFCMCIFSEVVEYAIHLHTGDLKKADATGEAYLCIHGEKSDSGRRWLNSRTSLITFASGQVKQ